MPCNAFHLCRHHQTPASSSFARVHERSRASVRRGAGERWAAGCSKSVKLHALTARRQQQGPRTSEVDEQARNVLRLDFAATDVDVEQLPKFAIRRVLTALSGKQLECTLQAAREERETAPPRRPASSKDAFRLEFQ